MRTIVITFIAGDQLERLLVLESEFGALPEFTPALDAVIDFLTTVRPPMNVQKWQIVHVDSVHTDHSGPYLTSFVGDKVIICCRKHG